MPKNGKPNTAGQVKQFLNWLDQNILLILSGFLLAFIPLFPKIPLFDVIPGYIVRVRPEDILILFTGLIWLIQVLRKKITIETPLTKIVITYAIIGLLSTLSAVFITKTVPLEPLHVGKTLLHFFRYIEYFSLFFFIFTSIKTKKDLRLLTIIVLLTILAVGVYGVGQKYLYWPVYSTMNREFSKGIRLYLTEHARVQSTFGGHYDLAAYLVIVLPLVMALYYSIKKKAEKYFLGVVFLTGLWLLVVSASRSSFAAFLAAALVVIAVMAFNLKTWSKRIIYMLKKFLVLGLVVSTMMLAFGDDMYDRFLQSLEAYPEVHHQYVAFVGRTKWLVADYIPKKIGLKEETRKQLEQIQNFELAKKPENALSTEEAEVLVASDQQPSQDKPSDVYVDVPDIKKVATISAEGNIEMIDTEVERTYSENAMKHGLSLAIRLDTLWPQAIRGFYTNPLLGSGYATLTKSTVGQFTEAESTDNNFLRTLGETGLLGFLAFYGAIVLAILTTVKIWKTTPENSIYRAIAVGFIAGTIGLLLNATYIDVFAASKVAFTYWSLAGLVLAIFNKKLVDSKSKS